MKIAARLRRKSTARNARIAELLAVGYPSGVRNLIREKLSIMATFGPTQFWRSRKGIAAALQSIYIAAMDAATLEHAALRLSAADRALLADRLLQTLDVEDAVTLERWGRAAESRLRSFERGEIAETDGPTAVAAIRRRLG